MARGDGGAGRDERLDLGAVGGEVVLRPSGADEVAGELTFDVIGRPRGFVTYPHVHARQVERFEMIAGRMRVDIHGRAHVLGPGERLEVPAGVPHRQRSAAPGSGHVRITVSPAGRTEEFLRRVAELSRDGGFGRGGIPRPRAAAELIRDFDDTGRSTFPPAAAQRAFARSVLAQPRRARLRALQRRPYEFVDEWDVAAPPAAVYAALADGRSYPQWWRPVYIAVETDGAPAVGSVACQHFKGRLPYHLHTRSTIVALEPGARIEAEVDGDLRGRGVWTLTATAAGTHVCFAWTVHADRPLLRALTPLLRPLLRANHAWAIARAIDGLEPYVRGRADRGAGLEATVRREQQELAAEDPRLVLATGPDEQRAGWAIEQQPSPTTPVEQSLHGQADRRSPRSIRNAQRASRRSSPTG